MIGMLAGFFGSIKKQFLIFGAIGVLLVVGYFYVSNMKNRLVDLREEMGAKSAVIELQDSTIKTLKNRLEETQVQLDNMNKKTKDKKKQIDKISNKHSVEKINKEIKNKNINSAEKEVNNSINKLFEVLKEKNTIEEEKNE